MLATASNFELVFKKPDGPPIVIPGDPIKLKQVVENILTNAVKYSTTKGHAVVTLSDQGDTVLFSCQDNGVGIPEDEQEAIFTKFFRARNILQKDTVGSGLGLYIAKIIIKAHGGTIGFTSKENEGTTVNVSLPKQSPPT